MKNSLLLIHTAVYQRGNNPIENENGEKQFIVDTHGRVYQRGNNPIENENDEKQFIVDTHGRVYQRVIHHQ